MDTRDEEIAALREQWQEQANAAIRTAREAEDLRIYLVLDNTRLRERVVALEAENERLRGGLRGLIPVAKGSYRIANGYEDDDAALAAATAALAE